MIKVNFRPHRGGFKEAMEKRKQFNTISELKQYLNGRPEISYYCHDTRLDVDTFVVVDGGPIGYVWFTEEKEGKE